MHNAAISVLGLNWAYVALEVDPAQLGQAIAGAKATRFIGLNLTVPHKLIAMDCVDLLAESAREWGAVNTIVFEGRNSQGEWSPLRLWEGQSPLEIRSVGHNTDVDGISRSLTEDVGMELKGATVLLLGAGGAGRSAALKMASEGVETLFLINRTAEKADIVASEIRRRFPAVRIHVGYPDAANQPLDLVLNATSLGLKQTDPLPLDLERVRLEYVKRVYDMIYRPAETPLLSLAKSSGCMAANGLGMLLHQGAGALELWTGVTAPVEVMKEALMKNIYGI